MPKRESSPHGQGKVYLHLWDSKESVAENLSTAKGKTTTSAPLRWASLTMCPKDRRSSRLEHGRLEIRGTGSTCAWVGWPVARVDQTLGCTVAPSSVCNSWRKHRKERLHILLEENQAVWWRLEPEQEAVSLRSSAFCTNPPVQSYQYPKRMLIYFISSFQPHHSPVTLSLLHL